MRSKWLYWGLFLGFLAIDQIVKFAIRANFHEKESYALWPNVLEITLQYNKGIAFGQLQGLGVFLSPIAILIAGGAAIYSHRNPKESAWIHIAMGLLSGGAIGNLYDRVFHGQVTDMFWFRAIDFPVFNVADACITVAASILVVRWGMESFQKPVPEPAPAKIEPEAEPTSAPEPGI